MVPLIVLGIFLAIFVIAALFAIGIYNRLVVLRNRYQNAFSQIDVQLKRRHDLIPNLVETAKGYIKHERGTLEAVISARNLASGAREKAVSDPGNPEAMKALSAAEGQLATGLKSLFAVAEAYPDLKANQNMMQLTEELSSTENKIAFSRQAYNDSVMEYNTARETFPTVLFAGILNFQAAHLFEIEAAAEREAPKVSF